MKRCFLYLICLLLGISVTYGEKVEVDGCFYVLNGETASVTYRGEDEDGWMYYNASELYVGDIEIPEKITYEGGEYTVTAIENDAFAGSKYMTTLTLPSTVTTIGSGVFSICNSLSAIHVLGDNPKYCSLGGIMYTKNPKEIYFVPRAISGDIQLMDEITKIPSSAFQKCEGLTTITLPDNVVTIEDGAFADCTNLEEVNLNNKLQSIGVQAFSKCVNLPLVKIPGSVKEIKASAFVSCDMLMYVLLNEGIESIGKMAFYNCQNIIGIQLPSTLKSIGDQAFKLCYSLSTVMNKSQLAIEAGSESNGYVAYYATEIIQETTASLDRENEKPIVLMNQEKAIVQNGLGHRYWVYSYSGVLRASGVVTSDYEEIEWNGGVSILKLSPTTSTGY